MDIRKSTKTLAVLLCVVLLGGALALSAWAAGGDITDRLREALQTETATIALYSPTERFSSCGEILYSDETGAMQLSLNGEDLALILNAERSAEAVYTPSDSADDTQTWDGETPYVKAGYVLVVLRCEGRDDCTVCLAEDYTLTAEDRAARREAEAAAQTEETQESAETQTDDPETAAVPVATPEPVVIKAPETEKESLFDRIGALSEGAVALLIAAMVLAVMVLAELALLVMYKRRAENVAKNYLRSKAALDANKRDLAAARTKNLRLERELLQEREKMAAVREELEKLKGVYKEKAPQEKPAEPERKRKTGYDMDYLNWTM